MTKGPAAFVEDLRPAIRQAAAIARALEGRVGNRPKSGEDTAVKAALTVADTACQEALLVPLTRHFSDVRLEAEEETDSVHRFTGRRDARVVVDPIDGTLRSYLRGEGPYAVMAGLALEDRFQAMILALPREGYFVWAWEGGGAFLARGDERARPAHARKDGDTVMVSYDLPEPVAERLRARGWKLVAGCGGAVAVAPLLPGVVGGLRVPNPRPLSQRGRIGLLASRLAGAKVARADGPASPQLSVPLPHVAVAADDAVLADLVHALEADA
jgi:fructose-1,6-bisphosphatase/inositol monophosphatase family enzyme